MGCLHVETLIAFSYFFFSMYIMALFQIWADARNPGSDKILPDVGFETLPHYVNNFMVTDIYVYGWLTITLVRLYYTGYFEIGLRRFFWICGTLYILRGFTITFTVLPTPYTGCQPHAHEIPLLTAVKIVFGNLSTCGDVLYSGHTMMLTASALMWQVYDKRKFAIVSSWIVSIVGMLIIVSTHFHYSDDVIIAFIFTSFTHLVYFFALQINYYERQLAFALDLDHVRGVPYSLGSFAFVRDLISILDGPTESYGACIHFLPKERCARCHQTQPLGDLGPSQADMFHPFTNKIRTSTSVIIRTTEN